MLQIPDDPIIRCIERTGYPPWMQGGYEDDEDEEYDDISLYRPPFADYGEKAV